MSTRPATLPRYLLAALVASLIASLALAGAGKATGATLFEVSMAALVAASGAYLLWRSPPAYCLSLALFASVFSGNWSAMGLPSKIPPDHILETIGILMVLLRAPAVADRRVVIRGVHWLMAAAVGYVAIDSWIANGHLAGVFQLLDGFGLYPFLFFLVAPVAFRTSHERNILLCTLVCLGAYLALTGLLEALHVNALVYPKYILNPLFGDPSTAGRVRGPFAAAVQDGLGLYGCAVACALAVAIWRRPGARVVAGLVGALCLLGAFLTEQRSIWGATAAATVVILLIVPRLRVWTVPAIAAGATAVVLAIALIPGLATNVNARVSDSEPVWERLNLDRAAENMIKAKPLFGFGWGRFAAVSGPYFRQSGSYPLVYTTVIHDVYLSFGAELGIVGLSLWGLVVWMGLGRSILRRPSHLNVWRLALTAYALCYLIVIAFVPPPTSFPPLFLWLLAGIVSIGDAGGTASADAGSSRGRARGGRGDRVAPAPVPSAAYRT